MAKINNKLEESIAKFTKAVEQAFAQQIDGPIGLFELNFQDRALLSQFESASSNWLALAEKTFKSLEKNNEFNSAIIFLNSLESLLKNDEFCKSEKWVSYLREYIEIMQYLLDDSRYDPSLAEEIKNKYITEDTLKAERLYISKQANNERHKESRSAKQRAINYYQEHRQDFKNKDAAALHIGGSVVGYPFSTVRGWLKNI